MRLLRRYVHFFKPFPPLRDKECLVVELDSTDHGFIGFGSHSRKLTGLEVSDTLGWGKGRTWGHTDSHRLSGCGG